MILEGLLDLPVMLQEAQILGHAVQALADGTQAGKNPAVELPWIGLAADVKEPREAEAVPQAPVQLLDLFPVALKELQEAGLAPRGAPAAQEGNMGQDEIQLLQIRRQILQPEGGALSDGDRLGRLIMGVAEGGEGLVFVCEGGQIRHDAQQLPAEIPQGVPIEDQIRVIGHVAAGGPQMNDAGGFRRRQAVGVDVGHNVMADFLFPGRGGVKIDVVNFPLQGRHLALRHGQPQLAFRPGQLRPQAAPGPDAGAGGEERKHIGGGVAGGKGRFIAVVHGFSFL